MTDALRKLFESQHKCSHDHKRSRRGTYRNPPTARDWKWFQAGAAAAEDMADPLVKIGEDGEGQTAKCPRCDAEPGDMCSDADGREHGRAVHQSRIVAELAGAFESGA